MARPPKPAHLRQGHRRGGFSVTVATATRLVGGLYYGRAAEAALKAAWGPDWLTKAIEEVKQGSASTVRTLLWAGLLAKNPALTEREVGAMGFDLHTARAAVAAGFRRSTWN